MKQISISFAAFLLCFMVLFNSCCDDYSDLIPGQDFIPDNILKDIQANGQTIYTGYSPPDLSGVFYATPVVLVSSNFQDSYFVGQKVVDNIFEFSDFDQNKLTLKTKITEVGISESQGYGSFVSGSGGNFTVYVKAEYKDVKGHTLLLTNVISGTVQNNGIRNLQMSLFMIDDKGDPNNEYIENGQGRLFKDGDGITPRQ